MTTNPGQPVTHPFHVSLVLGGFPAGPDLAELARRAESLGFDAMVIPDAPGFAPSVFPGLAWIAAATSTLQVGTHVLNNETRHPLHVAREAATVHSLSGGRFILGVGTGRDRNGEDIREYGIALESPGRRVARLEASLTILRALFAGETVTVESPEYTLTEAALKVQLPASGPPPILVAAGGSRMLSLAGQVADVVALGIDPLTGFEEVSERVGIVREAAAHTGRSPAIQLSLAGVGEVVHPWLKARIDNTPGADIANAPAFLMGDSAAMVASLQRIRTDLGISRIAVPAEFMDAVAPLIPAMR